MTDPSAAKTIAFSKSHKGQCTPSKPQTSKFAITGVLREADRCTKMPVQSRLRGELPALQSALELAGQVAAVNDPVLRRVPTCTQKKIVRA